MEEQQQETQAVVELLPDHLSIQEYAEKKGVKRNTVYRHMKADHKPVRIIADLVGASKTPYIDWEKYKDHEFSTRGVKMNKK